MGHRGLGVEGDGLEVMCLSVELIRGRAGDIAFSLTDSGIPWGRGARFVCGGLSVLC